MRPHSAAEHHHNDEFLGSSWKILEVGTQRFWKLGEAMIHGILAESFALGECQTERPSMIFKKIKEFEMF
jgi:hypothetical protein